MNNRKKEPNPNAQLPAKSSLLGGLAGWNVGIYFGMAHNKISCKPLTANRYGTLGLLTACYGASIGLFAGKWMQIKSINQELLKKNSLQSNKKL